VKEFWQSVNIWQSYEQEFGVLFFFASRCILINFWGGQMCCGRSSQIFGDACLPNLIVSLRCYPYQAICLFFNLSIAASNSAFSGHDFLWQEAVLTQIDILVYGITARILWAPDEILTTRQMRRCHDSSICDTRRNSHTVWCSGMLSFYVHGVWRFGQNPNTGGTMASGGIP